MAKTYSIMADFTELKAKHAFQGVTVKAGNFGLAIKRGLEIIRKRDGVKGQRISHVKVTAVEVKETTEALDKTT